MRSKSFFTISLVFTAAFSVNASGYENYNEATQKTTFGTEASDIANPVFYISSQQSDVRLYADGVGIDTEVYVYSDDSLTEILYGGIVDFSIGYIPLSDVSQYAYLYVTLKVADKTESDMIIVPVPASYQNISMADMVADVLINPGNINEITVHGLQTGDIIRIYADASLTMIIAAQTSAGTQVVFDIPDLSQWDSIYITRESMTMDESLPFVLGVAAMMPPTLSALDKLTLTDIEALKALKAEVFTEEVGEPFCFTAEYDENRNAVVKLVSSTDYVNFGNAYSVTISQTDVREPFYEGTIRYGEEILLTGLTFETEYQFSLTQDMDDIVTSYSGTLIIHDRGFIQDALTFNEATINQDDALTLIEAERENEALFSRQEDTPPHRLRENRVNTDISAVSEARQIRDERQDIPTCEYKMSKLQYANMRSIQSEVDILSTLSDEKLDIFRNSKDNSFNSSSNFPINDNTLSKAAALAAAGVYYEWEPNNSFGQANYVYLGDTAYGTIYPSGDTDYFCFTVSGATPVTINLVDIPYGCDYDLLLYNSSQNLIAQSATDGNVPEYISLTLNSGTYYIRVTPWSGNSSQYYRLILSGSSGSYGDRYEPNNSMGQATYIPINYSVSDANVHIAGDNDWYVFSVNTLSDVFVGLASIPNGCDYDLQLYNSYGNVIASSAYGGNQAEFFDIRLSPGTYYIRVYPYSGYSSQYYWLDCYATAVVQGDRYEPNNTMGTATSISNNATISDANLHATNDVDWYRFTISSPTTVNINLSNIPAGCDYDVSLYNSSGSRIAYPALGGNAPETINISLNVGTYYICVESWSGSSTQYYRLTMSATVTSQNPIITSPNTDNLSYSRDNLYVQWQAVSGATYNISMRDLTVNMLVFSDVGVYGNNYYTIDKKYFYEGHEYRIAVSANVGGNITWGERKFKISLSSARQTIIDRALNMNAYTWTVPITSDKKNLIGWGNSRTFLSGYTYAGIPYTQETQCSSIWPTVTWDSSNNYFNDKLSKSDFFSNTTSASGKTQPRYGSDCSGYASIAYNISRHTTHTWSFGSDSLFSRVGIIQYPNNTQRDELQKLMRLSPGDLINSPSDTAKGHCVIVYSIQATATDAYGNVTELTIITLEQTADGAQTTSKVWSSNKLITDKYLGRVRDNNLLQDYSWQWIWY